MRPRLALLFLTCAICPAQELINLARLSNSRVFTSKADEDAANLFDAGPASLKMLDGAVQIRFEVPVTVSRVVVRLAHEVQVGLQFTLHVSTFDGSPPFHSPLVPITGLQGDYTLPRPATGIRVASVGFYFFGRTIDVDEVEILGPPPLGLDLTPITPPLDPQLLREARQRAANEAREVAAVRLQAPTDLAAMRAIRKVIDTTNDRSLQARHWMKLQTAANNFAELLGQREQFKDLADEATSLGITIDWCEPSGSWSAKAEGYEKYLTLWPRGPEADEAWWKGRVESWCGDGEGTPEEIEYDIRTYSAFLKQFPNSKHAPQARQILKSFKAR
jgi:hypothetical protein